MKAKDTLWIAALILIAVCENAFGQAPGWAWAKSAGATFDDAGKDITVDDSGNVYVAGFFRNTVDFDPGSGILNLTSAGNADIFVSKFDPFGNLLWAKSLGGQSDDVAISLTRDDLGNLYLTGCFQGTADFDPDSGTYNLVAPGLYDIFILKLNANGNFVWANRIGGGDNDCGYSIKLDFLNNVCVTGSFTGVVDFDPDIDTLYLTGSGLSDIFIARFDNFGNLLWAKSMGQPGREEGNSLSIDSSGSIYVTGYFYGIVDFDPGVGVYNLTSSSWSQDIFILKLDSGGNFNWAKAIGSDSWDVGRSIITDLNGNSYSTGYFSGPADFNPGLGIYNLNWFGSSDMYVIKLDSSGAFVWAKVIGGSGADEGYFLTLDTSSNIYLAGVFSSTADFDPDSSVNYNLISIGAIDLSISKLDAFGNFLWAKSMGGTTPEIYGSLAFNTTGNMYVTGGFASPTILFDTIALVNSDTFGNFADIFIAKTDNLTEIANSIWNSKYTISLYPNPSTSHLTIALGGFQKNAEVSIADITGKVIYTATATETQQIEVSTKDFASGMYLVQVRGDDWMETRKVVVVK